MGVAHTHPFRSTRLQAGTRCYTTPDWGGILCTSELILAAISTSTASTEISLGGPHVQWTDESAANRCSTSDRRSLQSRERIRGAVARDLVKHRYHTRHVFTTRLFVKALIFDSDDATTALVSQALITHHDHPMHAALSACRQRDPQHQPLRLLFQVIDPITWNCSTLNHLNAGSMHYDLIQRPARCRRR